MSRDGHGAFEIDGLSISYEGFRPTTLVDFPQAEWRGSPDRQKLIDDFVAVGTIHSIASRATKAWSSLGR